MPNVRQHLSEAEGGATAKASRSVWLDVAKALGIMFVVLGHVVGAGAHLARGETASCLSQFRMYLYSFHMPLFFFLAGVTFKNNRPFEAFISDKAYRLLIPYFFFGILSALIYQGSGQTLALMGHLSVTGYGGLSVPSFAGQMLSLLHAGGWPEGLGFKSNSVLWFLPCLFVMQTVFYWVLRLERKCSTRLWIVLFVVVSYVGQYCAKEGVLPWGLKPAMSYSVFFFIGHIFCVQRHQVETSLRGRLFSGAGLVALGILLSCLLSTDIPFPWINSFPFLPNYLYGLILACVSIWGWVLLSSTSLFKSISFIGPFTLGIMLIHKFPLVFLQIRVPFITSLYNGGVLGGVAASLFVFFASMTISVIVAFFLKWLAPWVLGERPRAISA